ncbi:MAG: hypothetical protein RIQ59_379 [Bacteroidota bacterium]|jgi:uncharacterized membrane protein
MNDAHLHMVVNHFPIIGIILGLGILLFGIVLKNKSIINTAYGLLVVAALFAAGSMATGEGAEEMIEDLPTIGKGIIHEHEEIAEKFALLLYLLGAVSVAGIYLNFKNNTKSKLLIYFAIVLASVGIFLAQKTGTSGGEIRHTEIRNETTKAASNTINEEHKED